MAVMVLLGVGLGWFGWKLREAERQRRAVEAIRKAGGYVWYDYELDVSDALSPGEEPPTAASYFAMIERRIGIHFIS